jgi:GNAT superfamily N-acetyltransferase
MQVRQIDPHDQAAFDDWFAVMAATDNERWPDKPGWQRQERLAMALDTDGPEEHRCLSAVDDSGRVVGIGDFTLYRRENDHVADLVVAVLAGVRRRGVGSALVAEAERLARASGRRQLAGMDEVPVRAGYEDAAAPFARRLGFVPAQHMVRRELHVPIRSIEVLPPPGYSLITFIDRWPDVFLEDRCELGRRMSTDIPLGDQVRDEEIWDEARVRHIEASFAAQNRSKVTTAAVHDASGHVVAFTEIAVPLGAPESSWQHDTLVIGDHRGHGLGFAIKVANVFALLQAYPAVRTINTWNAAENEHMIAVNEAMGFEVAANSTSWLKNLAVPPGS